MAGAGIYVKGGDEVRRALMDAADDMNPPEAADREVGELVARVAARNAPKRTGALQRSIGAGYWNNRVRVSSDLIYAPVIEFGWPARHIEPAHYMTDAIASTEDRVQRIYQKHLDQITNRAERTTAA